MKLGFLNQPAVLPEFDRGFLPIMGDGTPTFQIATILDNQYVDMTSIINWDKYGSIVGQNTIQIRDEIISLITDFNSLTLVEKQIVCKYFGTTKNNRDSVYTSDQQTQLAINFQLLLLNDQPKIDVIKNASYYVNSVGIPNIKISVSIDEITLSSSNGIKWKLTVNDAGLLITNLL